MILCYDKKQVLNMELLMKSFRRILSLLLVIALTLTFVSTFYASDETQDNHEESLILGDIDQDGEITIMDATFIQRWLADLPSNDSIGKPMKTY